MIVSPSPDGAHNWNPMAFSPATGLVYLPAKVGTQFLHVPDPKWKYNSDRDNLGLDGCTMVRSTPNWLHMPPANRRAGGVGSGGSRRRPGARSIPVAEGGGVLATGGNLVFQGRADGILAAYRATDGKQLWTFDAGTGIMAPPVTYLVDGVQYVSVMAGWGGAAGLFNAPGCGPVKPGYGRILTFTLDGTATLKAPAYGHKDPPAPAITTKASPQIVHEGALLFNEQLRALSRQ